MSNRRCNYCVYKKYWLVHYPNLRKVPERGGTALYDGDRFLVWFMKLPAHCAC